MWITVAQAAALLGVSEAHVRRMILQKKLARYKVDKRTNLVDVEDVAKLVGARRER